MVTLVGLGGLLAAFSPIALARADRRRDPAVHRRAQVLRRRVPAVALAHARDARADVRRDGARAGRLREGGQAVRPRAALPATATRRSSTSSTRAIAAITINRGDLGARARHDRPGRVLRHVPVDRARDDRRHDLARRDDDVRRSCSSRRSRRCRARSATSAACTRTTSTCRTSTSSSTRRRCTPSGTRPTGPSPGDGVRFEHVSFAYPGRARRRARATSTLHIPPGSKLAIVGENGSGKTTLIKLLTRLYEPTRGPHHCSTAATSASGIARRAAPPHRRHLPGLRALPAQGRREHRRRRRSRVRRSRALGRRGRARPREAVHRRRCPTRYDTQLGKWFKYGPRAVARPVAEGRARALVHAPATPTSSCSTSRPPRWTPRPR